METYSTRGLPASRKLSYWNQISSETFAAMEVRARDSLGFDGLLSRAALGPLTLMDVHSAAARIRHTRSHIARAGDPSLLLLAPLQRTLQLSIDRGPVVTVGAGEFCFIDHARPYEIVHGDAVRTLCVDMPRRLIVPLLPRPGQLAGRLMRPDSANARLLSAALRCLGEEMNPGASAQFSPEVAHGLLSLIVAAYEPRDGTTGGRSRGSRAQAFRGHIDAYLGDPRLRPADVATRFGVSERYVRAVLGSRRRVLHRLPAAASPGALRRTARRSGVERAHDHRHRLPRRLRQPDALRACLQGALCDDAARLPARAPLAAPAGGGIQRCVIRSVSARVEAGPVLRLARPAHRRPLGERLGVARTQLEAEQRVHAGMAAEPAEEIEAAVEPVAQRIVLGQRRGRRHRAVHRNTASAR